jgi:UDP-N-acetylglucosamine diphosphorylase/glucosamine-1-phosphate N-acetyltransferase
MIRLTPDTEAIRERLYPFTATRNSWDLRLGILTIREKWACLLGSDVYTGPEDANRGSQGHTAPNLTSMPGNWVPTREMAAALVQQKSVRPEKILEFPWQLFQWNDWALREDFALLTQHRASCPIPDTVKVVSPDQVFLEPGARLGNCIINASTGPVYIGRNAEIMEGAMIRGPFSLGAHSVVKMGSMIYGATTIGPHCTVGGEIKNSILFGYSNKAHDGYLGDSVIGEWCNLGAGTTVSNIRNTGGEVSVWSRHENRNVPAGLKCGLLMGDYSRSAIHTSFNTGTVAGVCTHVFGSGLSPGFIDDFSWGMDGKTCYAWEKALRDIANWKQLKFKTLENDEIRLLKVIFDARWGNPRQSTN